MSRKPSEELSQWFAQWAELNPGAALALRTGLLANAGGGCKVYLPLPTGWKTLYRFPEASQFPALAGPTPERPAPVSFADPAAAATRAAARENYLRAAQAHLSAGSFQSGPASSQNGEATSPARGEGCAAPVSARGEA